MKLTHDKVDDFFLALGGPILELLENATYPKKPRSILSIDYDLNNDQFRRIELFNLDEGAVYVFDIEKKGWTKEH